MEYREFKDYVEKIERELGEEVKIFVWSKDIFLKELLNKYFQKLNVEVILKSNNELSKEKFERFIEFLKKEKIQLLLMENNFIDEIHTPVFINFIKSAYSEIKILIILEIKFLDHFYFKTLKLSDFFIYGADDIIFQPFSLEELRARIIKLLRDYYLYKKLIKMTNRDILTGVFNRRYFEEKVREEVYRAMRQKYPLTLLMCDLNNFKWYNDNFGHQAGDEALKKVGKFLNSIVRDKVDSVFRYGGDEFVIILPNTDYRQAINVARRIFNKWGELEIPSISIGIGISQLISKGDLEKTVYDLVRRADMAMYEAKKERVNAYKIDPETFSLEEPKVEKEVTEKIRERKFISIYKKYLGGGIYGKF